MAIAPILHAWISYDPANDSTPTYVSLDGKVRGFRSRRGRNSELELFEPGTGSLRLDNRNRQFDPLTSANPEIGNRIWLQTEHAGGELCNIVKGAWVTSWTQEQIAGDAVATATFADELSLFAKARLPVTTGPADTYDALVQQDGAVGYWPITMADDPSLNALKATIGPDFISTHSSVTGPIPIVGQYWSRYANYSGTGATAPVPSGSGLDPGGKAEFSVEFMYRFSAVPAVSDTILAGPNNAAGAFKWEIFQRNDGFMQFAVKNAVGTYVSAVSSGTLSANTTYHVVCTLQGNAVRIYLNGTQVGSTSFGGSLVQTGLFTDPAYLTIISAAPHASYLFGAYSLYAAGIGATHVGDHYQAATAHGYASETTGVRIGHLLDDSGTFAPRSIQTGQRTMLDSYKHGQTMQEEIDVAVQTEAINAGFFQAADGTLTYRDSAHRGSAPYTTSQVTFGDQGYAPEVRFIRLGLLEHSDAFLVNGWTVTGELKNWPNPTGFALGTASDATSRAAVGPYDDSRDGLWLASGTQEQTVATALLAKYKDAFDRINEIGLTSADPPSALAFFRRELLDRITLKYQPLGGGARYSQDMFIQSLEVAADDATLPWDLTIGVSPL